MDFKTAKNIIRAELTLASDEKLAEIIDAARAGEMPWMKGCQCFAGRILGITYGNYIEHVPRYWVGAEELHPYYRLSHAYRAIGGDDPGGSVSDRDAVRQHVLTAMALAELRARHRAQDLAAATEVQSLAALLGVE